MAFVGIVFVSIILILFAIMFFFMILFLVIGLIKKKKGKKSAVVFFVLSGLNAIPILLVILILVWPQKEGIETPSGTVYVWDWVVNRYEDAMENRDTETLGTMLSKNPELVYYVDINNCGILEYGMASCDIDVMQLGIQYGAKFDEDLTYENSIFDGSFPLFFENLGYRYSGTYVSGDTTDEIFETIQFMLENGADMELGASARPSNFLFSVVYWVVEDNRITKNDMELIMYIVDHGCTLNETYETDKTAMEIFEEKIINAEIDNDAEEFVYQFVTMEANSDLPF